MTWVKLCGLTSLGEVAMCASAGADALGFVVEYPAEVPWNLTLGEARELVAAVPAGVERVMVAGDDAGLVLAHAEALRPDAVQLHADEAPATTQELARELKAMGVGVIKALRFSVETGEVLTGHDSPPDPVDAARRLTQLGVEHLLVDSVSRTHVAGTGQPVDFSMARRIRDEVPAPVILAGGLRPDNVDAAIRAVAPHGVDVISGVEARRRVKDPAKVAAFIEAARGIA